MTSYHGYNINATTNQLDEVEQFQCECMDLDNAGDKVQVEFEFTFEEEGEEHTVYIYSWKEYRQICPSEYLEFHIGATSSYISSIARGKIKELLM